MARVFVSWEEFEGGWLPAVCVRCGVPAEYVVEWRLRHTQHRIVSIRHTDVTVQLPVCSAHTDQSWNGYQRVTPRRIDDEGIELDRVSPEFVRALDDYRRDGDGLPLFEVDLAVATRPAEPRRASASPGKSNWWIWILLLVFFGIPLLMMVVSMVFVVFALKFL